MPLILRYSLCLYTFFVSLFNVFSQEKDITTKFSQNGDLYPQIDKFSQPIAQFDENESCIVLDFVGNYTYKIKYNDLVGFVKDQYLLVNENMMDLYFDYEEKQRLKLLDQEKTRRQKVKEIQESAEKERIEYINQKNIDSIAKTREEHTKDSLQLKLITFRNTCHYQINEYDEFYKEVIKRTNQYSISENLTIELYRQGRSTNVFFNLSEDLGCASYLSNNRSTVKVYLENNTAITFYHSWGMECSDFNFKCRISNSEIKKLKASPIKSILLKGTEKSFEIENIKYKEFFIDKLKCIE